MPTDSTVRGPGPGRFQTLPGIQPSRFLRAAPGLRLIGVLSPLSGDEADPVYLHDHTTTIGRDEASTLRLADPLVSRQHARITHEGNHFRIDDLGSVNGTFVDSVPVISCELHDGDTLQIGATLFYFDRLYVRPAGPLSLESS